MWISRSARNRLLEAARFFPAVYLGGPRQAGKTSLMERTWPDAPVLALDRPGLAELAETSPTELLRGLDEPILLEAMISFLGFGDPKSVSWGQLLYFNYEHLKIAPWASIAPGIAIFITVLGFNLLADGMTDAFNPRLKE